MWKVMCDDSDVRNWKKIVKNEYLNLCEHLMKPLRLEKEIDGVVLRIGAFTKPSHTLFPSFHVRKTPSHSLCKFLILKWQWNSVKGIRVFFFWFYNHYLLLFIYPQNNNNNVCCKRSLYRKQANVLWCLNS